MIQSAVEAREGEGKEARRRFSQIIIGREEEMERSINLEEIPTDDDLPF